MKRKDQLKSEIVAIIEQLEIINLLRILDFTRALKKGESTQ